MKISKKYLLSLIFVPLAAFFLSGCGKKTEPNADFGPTPNPATQGQQAPVTTTPPETLPTLPASNTKAIDTEVNGIDQELQNIDSTLSSDAGDDELGL